MARRGWAVVPQRTAREYLATMYARVICERILRGKTKLTVGQCAAIGMQERRKILSGDRRPRGIDARDERIKLNGRCLYCGDAADSIDHLIPRLAGGPDAADNLIPACKACNSSKGATDLCAWADVKGFLPLHILRRYFVLAWNWTERNGLLDVTVEQLESVNPPFSVGKVPWHHERQQRARLPRV